MTYNNILTKYKIEYDKADITSSYPSLTDYEIKTILDKAYLALIAQKFTGNNARRQAFETDVKAIEDLKGLIRVASSNQLERLFGTNSYNATFNDLDSLYYIASMLVKNASGSSGEVVNTIKLVDHQTAARFIKTDTNYPWIKNPVACIEGSKLILIVDPEKHPDQDNEIVRLYYIKRPAEFTKSPVTTTFELSDTMAEELISLAIAMSLETLEQPRLSTKLQINQLES